MNGVRGRKIFINKPYFSSQSLSPLSLTPLWLGLRGCFHWCLHAPFASLSKPLLSEFLFHFMKLSWTLPFYLTYEALFINQGILHMYCEPEVFNLFFWHLILIFYPFPPPLFLLKVFFLFLWIDQVFLALFFSLRLGGFTSHSMSFIYITNIFTYILDRYI